MAFDPLVGDPPVVDEESGDEGSVDCPGSVTDCGAVGAAAGVPDAAVLAGAVSLGTSGVRSICDTSQRPARATIVNGYCTVSV